MTGSQSLYAQRTAQIDPLGAMTKTGARDGHSMNAVRQKPTRNAEQRYRGRYVTRFIKIEVNGLW